MIWRRLMLAVFELERLPVHVLDRVGRLSRGLDAQLELFHCVYEPEVLHARASGERAAEAIAARVEQRRRGLERLADVLRDQGLKVEANVRWDVPTYEGLVRHVQRNEPDLLIVPALPLEEGPRTPAYCEGRLIEECPVPVLFLKTREVYSQDCIVAALDPQPARAAGELEECILGAAGTMAHALADPPVRVFSAVVPGRRDWSGAAASGYDVSSGPEAEPLTETEARLERLASRHDIAVDDVHVELGEAVSLALYARETRAQAVVLGAASRTPAPGVQANALAEKILDALECDLLVVKARHAPRQGAQRPA